MAGDGVSAYGGSTPRLPSYLTGGAPLTPVPTQAEMTRQLQDIRSSGTNGQSAQRAVGAAAPITQGGGKSSAALASTSATGKPLSTDQQEQVDKLKARDTDVRAHEQAHRGVAGQYGSAATFTYQKGPDGSNYAIGGEVQIDTSAIPGDPRATIAKMETVQRAALAPADPSGQDMHVAAEAAQAIAQAETDTTGAANGSGQSGQDGDQTGAGSSKSGRGGSSAFAAQRIGSDQTSAAATTAAAAAAQSGGISALGGRLAIAAYGAAAGLGGSTPANTLRAVA